MRRFICGVFFGLCVGLFFGISACAAAQQPPTHTLHPLTVRGTAKNSVGQPVAGAKVFLLSTNRTRPGGFEPLLAETTTDGDGRYVFDEIRVPALPPDGGPIHKHAEGLFQVYALADGYGFTWHPQQHFRPEAMRTAEAEKEIVHAGEPCVADLKFEPAATVRGRVTNDRGEPVKGATVQLGQVNDVRRPGSVGGWRCNYLGPPSEDERAIADEFAGIVQVPKEKRSAVTDDEGRYSISGLRRETSYLTLIDYQPEYEPLVLGVATTDSKKSNSDRPLGYDGQLNHVFTAPRKIRVHVIAPDDGSSVANVTIRAGRRRLQRAGNLSTTDASGAASLHLPPDTYTLYAEPPPGVPYLLTELPLTVAPEDEGREVRLTLTWGTTVIVSAALAETGKPVSGVEFLSENADGTERHDLHTQSVFLDYPATDKSGTLRAVVAPGRTRLVVGKHPADVEPVRGLSELIELATGQIRTVEFEFRKKETSAQPPPAKLSDKLEKVRALIDEQQALSSAGTYQIRVFQSRLEGASPADLRSILEACDYQQIPDIVGLIQQRFPQKNLRLVKGKAVVDGQKRRSELFDTVTVDNGREVAMLMQDNAQASIYNRQTIYVHGPERLLRRAFFPGAAPGEEQPMLQTSRENGKLTLIVENEGGRFLQVIEEKSGFLIHSSSSHGEGSGSQVWQFAPHKTATGLLIAGLSVEFRYARDRLRSVYIDQLDEAVLNRPPPETFVVAGPPGTNIVDFRGDQSRPKSAMASYPIRDVVRRANQIDDSNRSILPVVKVGQVAPPIAAAQWLSASGKTTVPELAGKVVLIDFWGIGCGPCIAELPEVQALAKEFAGQDFVLVGLHYAGYDAAEVAEFAQKRGMTYPVAIDQPAADSPAFGATFKAYGIRGIPNCAVLDRAGKVAFVGRFDDAAREAAKLLEAKPD
jgi:thiol-disulfide isomerase/thioredoxin